MYTTGKLNEMWKLRFQIFLIDILEEKSIDNMKQEQKVSQERWGGEGWAWHNSIDELSNRIHTTKKQTSGLC